MVDDVPLEAPRPRLPTLALLVGRVTTIKLVRLEWGPVNVTGSTATATTYETWQATMTDGSVQQNRDENDYTLVLQDGKWLVSGDDQPGGEVARLSEAQSQTKAVREAGPLQDWGKLTDAQRASIGLPAVPPAPRKAPSAEDQQAVAQHVQNLAGTLLSEGQASVVIGYTAGSLPGQMVPAFVTGPEQAGTLGWSERCFNDLAVYLPSARRQWGKVAVVVEQCDARAAVGLLQENQVARDNLTLIGVSCPGVWNDGQLAAKCYPCDGEVSSLCDWTVTPLGAQKGAVASGAKREVAADPRDALVAHLERLPAQDRWAYWQGQFDRCLRCYGCRAACPLCYCSVCVADKNQPQWIPARIDAKGNMAWNITRAFHLVGRCGGCDECARVCPADVRLDLLNHRLSMEVETRFGYRSGQDPGASPPLATFRPDDPQAFIR